MSLTAELTLKFHLMLYFFSPIFYCKCTFKIALNLICFMYSKLPVYKIFKNLLFCYKYQLKCDTQTICSIVPLAQSEEII